MVDMVAEAIGCQHQEYKGQYSISYKKRQYISICAHIPLPVHFLLRYTSRCQSISSTYEDRPSSPLEQETYMI